MENNNTTTENKQYLRLYTDAWILERNISMMKYLKCNENKYFAHEKATLTNTPTFTIGSSTDATFTDLEVY